MSDNKVWYLTFRASWERPSVTVFAIRAPSEAYAEMKRAGWFVCYGVEGQQPKADSHKGVGW